MPGRLAFLDTNGWLALLNSSDALHDYAEAAWTELLQRDCSVVLTDWVVAETGNGLARTSLEGKENGDSEYPLHRDYIPTLVAGPWGYNYIFKS